MTHRRHDSVSSAVEGSLHHVLLCIRHTDNRARTSCSNGAGELVKVLVVDLAVLAVNQYPVEASDPGQSPHYGGTRNGEPVSDTLLSGGESGLEDRALGHCRGHYCVNE